MGSKTKIIFYGGCTGINKSERLKQAISEKENFLETIKISDYFLEAMKDDKNRGSTIWKTDDWKKHENNVIDKLIGKIKDKHKLFIINNHFSTISPYGYIPGLDMDSLEKLIFSCYPEIKINTAIKKGQDNPSIEKPVIGILHIDTKIDVIYKHYMNLLDNIAKSKKNNTDNAYAIAVFPYISKSEIEKDLQENRFWADAYSMRTRSICPDGWVKTKTIYQGSGDADLNKIKNEISQFINDFIN